MVLNSTTTIIDLPVAITDYLSEFSESAVANINFVGEPITEVTLDPANVSINIDSLLISPCMLKYIIIGIITAQFLSLDLLTPITL